MQGLDEDKDKDEDGDSDDALHASRQLPVARRRR
jgi:hypothetical protein